MTFGKPGRPPEDRQLRQREIYEAVSPLILAHGTRFSMREAAQAAFLSIGGLYHYFPTKRDLLLYGVSLEARDRVCTEEMARIGNGAWRSEALIDTTVDAFMRIFAFIRPSALVALDLGGSTLQDTFDRGWTSNLGSLADAFRRLLPNVSNEHRSSLARTIRWIIRGALIDRQVNSEQVRADLRVLIAAQVEGTLRQGV